MVFWLTTFQVLEHIRFRGLPLSPALYEEAVAACAGQQDARRLVGKMMAAGYEPSEFLGFLGGMRMAWG